MVNKRIFIIALIALTGTSCWGITSVTSDERLLHAAKTGDINELTQALQEGAAVDATDKNGHTALWLAKKHGHKVIVAELLKKGAAKTDKTSRIFNIEFIKKYKVLVGVSIFGLFVNIWYLYNALCDIYAPHNVHRDNPDFVPQQNEVHRANRDFIDAVWDGNINALDQALAAGADINIDLYNDIAMEPPFPVRPHSGMTALNRAARGGDHRMLQALIDRRANVNVPAAADGYTVLMAAVTANNVEGVQALLANNADVNTQTTGTDSAGLTALIFAVEERRGARMVQALLDGRADTSISVGDEGTALDMALRHGDQEIIRILQEASLGG